MRMALKFVAIVAILLFIALQLDTPTGEPTAEIGVLKKGIYINPRLEPPYTRLFVELNNKKTIVAEGPAGMKIKKGRTVLVLRYNRLISRRFVYWFSEYVDDKQNLE